MVLCRAILHYFKQVPRKATRKSKAFIVKATAKDANDRQLFYGKRSQFVSGLEAEVTPVSIGRSVSL